MTEVKIGDKLKYLNENYPFAYKPTLAYMVKSIHFDEIIQVGDYKVFKDELNKENICCPNSPKCDGTVSIGTDISTPFIKKTA